MADDDLFPGGEPPDRSELLRYLIEEHGLSTPEARQVANRYHEPEKGSLSGGSSDVEWTESRLRLWVEAQPEVSSLPAKTGRAIREAAGVEGGTYQERNEPDDVRLERANRVAEEAAGRAGRTRDRFYRAADMYFDSGPAMDPNALAQSLAVGVFTDASGNPKIDPETGQPIEVTPGTLWQAIKGQTFDMGSLAMPRAGRDPRRGARAGREGADDARLDRLARMADERRTFITPSMAMAILGNMDDDGVIKLQQQLWEAGLFGEVPPSWGVADETTRKAYMALFAEASLTPDDPIDQILERLKDEAITRGMAGGTEGEVSDVPAFKPEIASAETLRQLVDDIAQDMMGRFATDEEKERLVGQLQSREIANQRAQYDRDVAEAGAGGGSGGGPPGGIDAFMAAIGGLESGGNYDAVNAGSGASGKFQIMPSNWGPWAERAGIGRNAPRTPANQERVARHVMGEYYQRFGNWRDVAIAWFAGPGAVGAPNAERRSDGNMTVREYADSIMNRMAQQGGGTGGGAGAAAGMSFDAIETFDPAAEAEAALKAADPAGWAGHQFANRATEYFSLLGGLV